MTSNIAYVSALQAPVALSNPTGSLGLVGTQLGAAGQASIQPPQGVLAFTSTPSPFAFKMATQPGTCAMAGTAASSISGTVSPRAPVVGAVGLSGSAPSVTAAAGTTGMKFHPSVAYWQMDYNTSYSTQIARFAALKAKCPQTQGFEVFLHWSDLENPALVGGAAQYDGLDVSWATGDQTNVNNQKGFKLVDSLINAAAALGCQLMLSIHSIGSHSNGGDVSPNSFPSNFLPTYLSGSAYGPNTAASNGVWGGVWLNSYAGNGVQFTMYFRYWVQAVADRLNLLGAAYGARYDTNSNLETFGFAADEMVISAATTCTDAGQLATLTGPNGLMASWRASFPRTQLRLWANYFQTVATMDTFLAEAVNTRRWSVGGPDTCNDAPVVSADPTLNSDGQYRSIAAAYRWLGWTASGGDGGSRDLSLPSYASVGHCICEVEAEDTSYDAVSGTTIGNARHLGDGILPHIVNQANRLGATHMVWFDNTFSGRSQVQTNTASPNLCDFISSVAQGGNVSVNGVIAGIALTNNIYPPSFGGAPPPSPPNLQIINQGGPNNSTAPVTNSQQLTWTGVTGASPYKVYRDGGLIASPTATNYTDAAATNSNDPTFATAATTHAYWVTAVVGGIESAPAYPAVYLYRNGQSFQGQTQFSFGTLAINWGYVFNGRTCIRLDYPSNGAGFQPLSGPPVSPQWDIELGAFKYYTIDVCPLAPTDGIMRFGNVSRVPDPPGDIFGNLPQVNIFNYGPAPVVGQWGTYKIPLADTGMGTCQIDASISGNTLTVFGVVNGPLIVDKGGFITGAGVTAGSWVSAASPTVLGGAGTYTLAASSTVARTTLTYKRSCMYKLDMDRAGVNFASSWLLDNMGFLTF